MKIPLKSARKITLIFILLTIIFVLIISWCNQDTQKQANSNIQLDSVITKLIEFKSNSEGLSKEELKLAETIHGFGDTAIPKLILLLKNKDNQIKKRAAWTISLYDNIDIKYLNDLGDALISGELWLGATIAKIGNDSAIKIMIEALKKNKENESTLTHSFEILGQKCIPSLVQLLKCNNDCDEELLYAVSSIFGFLGKEAIPAINSLDSLAKDKRNSLISREFAIISLGNIGIYARYTEKDLYQILKEEPAKFSEIILTALVAMKSSLAVEPYLNKLEQINDDQEKILSLRDLSAIGLNANKAGEKIIKYLNDENWDLRVAAARTMGFIGYKPAIPELQKLLFYENDWRLNYVSILSLEMLNASNALQSLKEIETNHWFTPVKDAARHAILKIKKIQTDTISNSYSNFAFGFFSYQNILKNAENCRFESDPFIMKFHCWNGKLIGEDNGEWGGSLRFIDSKGKSFTLLNENIKSIIEFNGNVIVFTGLAHMSFNDGALYQLSRDKKRISVKKIIILPGSPSKIKVNYDDMMIDIDQSGTYILTKEMKLKEAICK